MMDLKSIFLIAIIVLLIAAAGYLTYTIQDGSDPLVILKSFAQDDTEPEDEFADDELLAQANETPTPTVAFTSTSPTPTTGAGVSETPSPSPLVSGTVTPSPSPTLTPTETPTPTLTPSPIPTELPETGGGTMTPAVTLPVAGVGDWFNPIAIGGGVLILLALML